MRESGSDKKRSNLLAYIHTRSATYSLCARTGGRRRRKKGGLCGPASSLSSSPRKRKRERRLLKKERDKVNRRLVLFTHVPLASSSGPGSSGSFLPQNVQTAAIMVASTTQPRAAVTTDTTEAVSEVEVGGAEEGGGS